MKQTNFSLADILTILTALVFGYICFLGANFITMGNTRQSIILSLIITLLLMATSMGAKLLKRTKGNFKMCFIWEVVLLVFFTVFMLYFTITPFSHYFVVAGQKQKIQNKLTASITEAENMFAEYEKYAQGRENLYKSKLQSVVDGKLVNPGHFKNFGFVDNVSPATQINNKMFTLHAELFPTNYSDSAKLGLKDVAIDWLSDAKNKINSWKAISIVSLANVVEHYSNEWRDSLISLSTVREKGEQAQDFHYKLSFMSVNDHFTSLEKPSTLAIVLAISAYLLMLLSYLITKRSTKTPIGVPKSVGVFDVEY